MQGMAPGDLPLRDVQEPGTSTPDGPRRGLLLIAAVALAIVLVVGGWWLGRRDPSPSASPQVGATEQVVEEPPAAAATGTAPVPLDESDAFVRKLVQELTSHPELARWLATEQLVRKFVAMVDNVAEGETPAAHVRHVAPSAKFETAERGDRLVIDPRSYARYDNAAALVAAIDAAGAARLYGLLKPLIDEAYSEVGGADRSFDVTLTRAIRRLVSTPVADAPLAVEPYGAVYRFADEDTEARTAAEKHLLRMGPQNARIVQRKLGEIAAALGVRP